MHRRFQWHGIRHILDSKHIRTNDGPQAIWDRSRILSSCLVNALILWYPTASNAILRSGFPSSARGIIGPRRHYPRANACHADSAASANRTALLENRPATATHVEKFLHRIHDPLAQLLHGAQKPEALAEEEKRGARTMPVSADRCCDWKKTASGSWQLGHSLFDRGS